MSTDLDDLGAPQGLSWSWELDFAALMAAISGDADGTDAASAGVSGASAPVASGLAPAAGSRTGAAALGLAAGDPDDPAVVGDPARPDDPARVGDPARPEDPARVGDPARPHDPARVGDPALPDRPYDVGCPADRGGPRSTWRRARTWPRGWRWRRTPACPVMIWPPSRDPGGGSRPGRPRRSWPRSRRSPPGPPPAMRMSGRGRMAARSGSRHPRPPRSLWS